MSLPENFEGKFEILHKLSEGGMGEVYKVRHLLLDQIQVIKVIRAQHDSNEKLGLRFRSEAQTAIRLSHQNIAQIYDFAIGEGGTAYIVMEYIEGKTLKEVLAKRGRLPVEFVVELAHQSLSALDYLHREGYVHRDVSPDNIMLTTAKDGSVLVKLIDLGVAKHVEAEVELTATGMFLGKARYSPPERFRGQATADPRSDVYSFGVMLYELLTGASPIEGTDFTSLASSHLFKPPVSFDISDPKGLIPVELRNVIFHALEKDPDDRIASAAELDQKLQPFRLLGATIPMPTSGAPFKVSEARVAAETLDPSETRSDDAADSGSTDATVVRSGSAQRSPLLSKTAALAVACLLVISGIGLWWKSKGNTAGSTAAVDVPKDEVQYLEAVDRIASGETTGINRLLRQLIQENPAESTSREWMTAGRNDPYLPHFYLGLAYFRQNNCVEAPEHLAESARQQVVQSTSFHQQLLDMQQECQARFADEIGKLDRVLSEARDLSGLLDIAITNEGSEFDVIWQASPGLEQEIRTELERLRELEERFEAARHQGLGELILVGDEIAEIVSELDKLDKAVQALM